MLFQWLLVLIFITQKSWAFQGGVRCETLNTVQLPKAQNSTSPYGVRVTDKHNKLVTKYMDGEIYTVEIYGRCGIWVPIQGFLIVAKHKTSNDVIGEFLKDDSNFWQASHFPCRDIKLGSVTHYVAYPRLYPVKFHWTLNSYISGRRFRDSENVIFQSIIFQDASTYWQGPAVAWPEASKASNCHCVDKAEANCKFLVTSHQCDTEYARDSCAYACNDCSTEK